MGNNNSSRNRENGGLPGPSSSLQTSDDDIQEESGLWAYLPALIVYSIATRLTCMQDLVAFGGTCRHWRSVVTGEGLVEHFTQHHVPLMIVMPLSFFEKGISFLTKASRVNLLLVRITDGKVLKRYAPGIDGFWFHGDITFGHLILLSPRPRHYHHLVGDVCYSQYDCSSGKEINIILLNMLTGAQIKFRTPAPPLRFEFVSLTAPPTSPDCFLVLISNFSIQYLHIGGGACRWTAKEYRKGISPECVTSAVTIKDRLYVATIHGQVAELMIDPPRTVTSKSLMLLEEDSPASLREIMTVDDGLEVAMIVEWQGKLIIVCTNRARSNLLVQLIH